MTAGPEIPRRFFQVRLDLGTTRVRAALGQLEVDRAVAFGLAARFWTLAAAPVTALLIATRFTPQLQGYYYTFASLLSLQVFIELGLGTVIVQFVSHEWSRLALDSDGRIVGDADALRRLSAISRLATRWYVIAAPIAVVGLIAAGFAFFRTSGSDVEWRMPWTALCILTGVKLMMAPIWSVLEGANQVRTVYGYRLFEGTVTSLALWFALVAGAGLWAIVISGAAMALLGLGFLRRRYWTFIRRVLSTPTGEVAISWRRDLLPMQWRIAVSWLCGYFVFSLFTPVLFKYHGPVVAGQMGMTWSIVSVIGLVPAMWLAPKVPVFGMLVARRDFAGLDRLFWKLTKIMVALAASLGLAAWLAVVLLYQSGLALADRILPPLPTALFIAAQVILVSSLAASAYLRAHKREPLLALNVASAISIAGLTMALGRDFGPVGVAAGYFATTAVAIPLLFLVWARFRTRWHAVDADPIDQLA